MVSWTHKFICLSERGQCTIPTTDAQKDMLFEAGLGEPSVFIPDIDFNVEMFREELDRVFPKLKDGGGYLFAKCSSRLRHVHAAIFFKYIHS